MEDTLAYISLLLSVLAGGLLVLFFRRMNEKATKIMLAFSGAFLLGISFLHLIPEVYSSTEMNAGIYILIGFLFQLLLEFFSDGIEHGHVHVHDHEKRFPVVIMISLCLHAFVEGIPLEREIHESQTGLEAHGDHSLLLGIVLHNIPVSLALMTMFIKSGLAVSRSFFWLMIFAVMGPLGAFTGHHFGMDITAQWQGFFDVILAVVIGMFLHISTTILFESTEGHRFNLIKMISILAGVSIAMLNL